MTIPTIKVIGALQQLALQKHGHPSSRLASNLLDCIDIVDTKCSDLSQDLSLAFTLLLGHVKSNCRRDHGHGEGLVPFRRQDSVCRGKVSAKIEEVVPRALNTSYPCPGRHVVEFVREQVLDFLVVQS